MRLGAAIHNGQGGQATKIIASIFGLAMVSLFYYGSYYNYGFEWGDIGSYVQIVYEYHNGSKPGDFLGYGMLWYYFGLSVFKVLGVDYNSILIMFHVLMFVVTCCLFFSVYLLTRSVWAAAAVALVFIAVPPFTASTIRSLSFGLNALAFVLFARAPLDRGRRELVLAAAVVGVTFMLRPDFGYFYAACLWIIVALRCVAANPATAAAVALVRSSLVMGAVIVLTMAPLFLHAAAHGYLSVMLDDYLSYPRRILFFILQSPSLAGMAGDGASDAPFLRILPVGAMFGSDPSERIFAFLIYSTMLVMAAFALYCGWRWSRRPRDVTGNLPSLAALAIVAGQWPIFAFFRPSWPHFVTFMHAYLLLAAVAAALLARPCAGAGPGRFGIRAAARTACLLLLGTQIVLFVVHGLQVPGVGVLAMIEGRDQRLRLGPGIDLVVSDAEKRQYETIDTLIRANSRPGDRIVCAPYCPGYAFMAERRMLFREHYVDDATPRLYPGWIDRAIALTVAEKPPVIIVQDWAPNGTEASKFVNWAARYMEFVRETYPRAVSIPGGTAYLLDQAEAPEARMATVEAYGPTSTRVGVPFNEQPGGFSAIWLKAPGLSDAARVEMDGVPLASTVVGDVISALVPADLISAPGRMWLQVTDPIGNLKTVPVPFDVQSP